MEKIIEIKDYEGVGRYAVAGFQVMTDKQLIRLYIDNQSQCCESWGYFWCNDNPQDFVGAELRGVSVTDTALNEALVEAKTFPPEDEYFTGGVMFVNLETDRGTLQFVAYNEHNGFYGHLATVESTQLAHTAVL